MKALTSIYSISEGVTPEKKDLDRINSIMAKANGSEQKAIQLASTMASRITDKDKMIRRYAAAAQLLGPDHPVTKCFSPKGETTEPKTGKSVLAFLQDSNPSIYQSIVKAFKAKGLNFNSMDASKIQKLTPSEAFKYGGTEGDKYFKIWLIDDAVVAFCTWANTMIDSRFKWNHKGKGEDKRNYSDIIGTKECIDGYYKSNSYINKCNLVYMIPFTAFGSAGVEVVEDERSKFLNSLNSLSEKTFVFDKIGILDEAKKYLEKCRRDLNNALQKITVPDANISASVDTKAYDRVYLEGSQSYGFGRCYIKHDFYFNFELPDYSYGKYDWDGHTRSEGIYYYDEAKAQLRKAGIKMSFASDAKKVASNLVKQAKKLPQSMPYYEACEAYYKYKRSDLVTELKGGLVDLLLKLGFTTVDGDGIRYRDVKFAVYFDNGVMFLFPYSSGSKSLLASSVKQIANSFHEYFTLKKVAGTIVPELVVNPNIVKSIKSVKTA